MSNQMGDNEKLRSDAKMNYRKHEEKVDGRESNGRA